MVLNRKLTWILNQISSCKNCENGFAYRKKLSRLRKYLLAKIYLSVIYGKTIVINNQVDLAEMRKGEYRVRNYISNSYSLSKLI